MYNFEGREKMNGRNMTLHKNTENTFTKKLQITKSIEGKLQKRHLSRNTKFIGDIK